MGQPVLAVEGKEGRGWWKGRKNGGLAPPYQSNRWWAVGKQADAGGTRNSSCPQILVYRNLAIWHHYLIICNLPKLQPISNLRSTLLEKGYFKKEKKMKRSQLQCCSNYNRNCVIVWLDLKSSTDERGGWWPKRLCLTYLKLWWLHGRRPCGAEADSWRPCCGPCWCKLHALLLLVKAFPATTAFDFFSMYMFWAFWFGFSVKCIAFTNVQWKVNYKALSVDEKRWGAEI